jgi:hypothetical protein
MRIVAVLTAERIDETKEAGNHFREPASQVFSSDY